MTVMAFIIGLPVFKCIAAIPPKVVILWQCWPLHGKAPSPQAPPTPRVCLLAPGPVTVQRASQPPISTPSCLISQPVSITTPRAAWHSPIRQTYWVAATWRWQTITLSPAAWTRDGYNAPEKLDNRIVGQWRDVVFALNEGNTLASTRSGQGKGWTTVCSSLFWINWS